jgi:hypothetical protein
MAVAKRSKLPAASEEENQVAGNLNRGQSVGTYRPFLRGPILEPEFGPVRRYLRR